MTIVKTAMRNTPGFHNRVTGWAKELSRISLLTTQVVTLPHYKLRLHISGSSNTFLSECYVMKTRFLAAASSTESTATLMLLLSVSPVPQELRHC